MTRKEKSPLAGKRVVITRPDEGARSWIEAFEEEGASVVHLPIIRFKEPDSWDQVDRAIELMDTYDLVVFTSANAARRFLGRMRRRKQKVALNRCMVAAIAPKTAEVVRSYGVRVDIVPPEGGAGEELCDLLAEKVALQDARILYPRARETRDALPKFFNEKGASLDSIIVYQTGSNEGCREGLEQLFSESADWVTFASGSAVRSFFNLGQQEVATDWFRKFQVRSAVLGRVTAGVLREYGISPSIETERPFIGDMVGAMRRWEVER